MSADVSYPEDYPLIDKDGKNYRLLVNTDTDSWYFKILFGDFAVGEASCVQECDQLVVRHFLIQRGMPMPEGWLSVAWRKLTGDPPLESILQGLGLGTALLKFITERARDFIATEVVIDFKACDLPADAAAVQWFQRRGFQLEAEADGSPTGTARLILVKGSRADAASNVVKSPKKPQRKSRNTAPPKKLPTRQPKPGATERMIKTRSANFTKESLAKLFRPISDLLNGKLEDAEALLDPAIRDLFKASTTLVRHSKDTRVLQYHIWARDQPGIFHRHHFKYAIQYDPLGTMGGTATKNFTIEFFVNKIRIYQERESMGKRVGRDLTRIRVPGFTLCETDRFFCFDHKFNASTEAALLREIRKHLFPLLNTVHPMFYRILDAYNLPLTKEQRRAVISGRKKLGSVDRSSPHYGKNPEYRREVSPALRRATFHRDGNVCQHCERKFPLKSLHADHVLPVARGGLTFLGNLQTLCGPCNLKKGKRLESEL